MPQFTMLVGLPGAGKTTYRRKLIKAMTMGEQKNTFRLALDDQAIELASQFKTTYEDIICRMGNNLVDTGIKNLRLAIDGNRNIIIDADNVAKAVRQRLLMELARKAKLDIYHKICIYLAYPDDIAYSQVTTRVNRNEKRTSLLLWTNKKMQFIVPHKGEGFDTFTVIPVAM